jgi:hypothetical protein
MTSYPGLQFETEKRILKGIFLKVNKFKYTLQK